MPKKSPILQILVVISSILLSACASNGVSELYDFHTIETEDDRKVFEYRYPIGVTDSGKSISSRKVFSFEDMREELNKYMEVFRYCEQGFFVYDETFDGREYALRGECQEPK